MGEGDIPGDIRGGHRSYTRQRLTVAQAAEALGVTVDAVRSRIKRGTIDHVREGGRVYVILGGDQGETSTGQGSAQVDDHSPTGDPDPREELVESLLDQVAYIRDQLAEEREARRRADTIIAQLTQANAEQARTIRALEAPQEPRDEPQEPREYSSDPRGSSESDEGPPYGTSPQEADESLGRRSWWRRFFGFE